VFGRVGNGASANIPRRSAPLSLFNLKPGQQADVRVSHKLQEEYKAPKATVKPFVGEGQRLGR
jgi:UBX domain-containing protein 1